MPPFIQKWVSNQCNSVPNFLSCFSPNSDVISRFVCLWIYIRFTYIFLPNLLRVPWKIQTAITKRENSCAMCVAKSLILYFLLQMTPQPVCAKKISFMFSNNFEMAIEKMLFSNFDRVEITFVFVFVNPSFRFIPSFFISIA